MAVELTPRFDRALAYASDLHRDQRRKGGGIPYISHLLAVASFAIEYGADEDEAIAALLHDAIEDQGGPFARAEIQQRFGERVTAIVDGCTDADRIPKPPWRERKEAFIAGVATADASVRLVIACDKLHNLTSTIENLRDEGASMWERFRGGRDGTLWYYRSLAVALMKGGLPGPLARRLTAAVDTLERESLPG